MKKFFVALTAATAFAVLPSFALAAPATDPQTTAAVKAMLDALEVRKMMAASFAEMEKSMPAMLKAQIAGIIQADGSLNAQQKQEALAKADKALPGMMQVIGKILRDPTLLDQMVDEMVPLYASHFTAAEIRELTAFYRTPLGRKMMTTMPKLSAESMAIGQRIVMPRLGKAMQEMMQGTQKR